MLYSNDDTTLGTIYNAFTFNKNAFIIGDTESNKYTSASIGIYHNNTD